MMVHRLLYSAQCHSGNQRAWLLYFAEKLSIIMQELILCWYMLQPQVDNSCVSHAHNQELLTLRSIPTKAATQGDPLLCSHTSTHVIVLVFLSSLLCEGSGILNLYNNMRAICWYLYCVAHSTSLRDIACVTSPQCRDVYYGSGN